MDGLVNNTGGGSVNFGSGNVFNGVNINGVNGGVTLCGEKT